MKTILKNSSIWWRGKIEVRYKKIYPLAYKPFDPFKYYFPEPALKLKERSLPYIFMAVNTSKISEVVSFCEQYGVLGSPGQTRETFHKGSPSLSVIFGQAKPHSDVGDILNPQTGGAFPTTNTEKLASLLCAPMSIEVFTYEQYAMKQAISGLVQYRNGVNKKISPELVRDRFAVNLSKISMSVELKSSWGISWEGMSLTSILYLMLALDLQGKILQCLRCRKAFRCDSPKAKYCSEECRNAFNVSFYLFNKRQEEKGKKRVNVDQYLKKYSPRKKGD